MAKLDENYFKNDGMQATNIEDTLAKDEQVLWRGKPKRSAYIWGQIFKMMPVALIWILIDGIFIGCMFGFNVFSQTPWYMVLFLCVFFLFHLTPVWIWIANMVTASIQQKNMEYVFTNTRIIIKSGVIGIDLQNIYYADIESVNLKVGLSDKWFKVGDIYIRTKSNSKVLWDISDPYNITTKLQKIVNDIKSDVYFPNELRTKVNKGFATRYEVTENEKKEITKKEDK